MTSNCRILQEEAEAEAVLKINTQGCIPRIQTLIENNLYPVVGVAIGVAVSQVSLIADSICSKNMFHDLFAALGHLVVPHPGGPDRVAEVPVECPLMLDQHHR